MQQYAQGHIAAQGQHNIIAYKPFGEGVELKTIYTFGVTTTFLKPIAKCGENNNLYSTMNNRIEKQINSSKETMILIINYIKKTRIIIISILVLVILLKIIQIFTNLSIITILYHLISYISLIILLVLSITLFIPKKVLSQQKYTKKITKNLKFIVNIENILMFVGAIILILIKVIEIIF